MAEAERIARRGGSMCEQAWASTMRIARRGERTAEAAAAFLAACATLPEVMQRCLAVSYAASHRDECAAARREHGDVTRQTLAAFLR